MKFSKASKQWAVFIAALLAVVAFDHFGGFEKLQSWWSRPPPAPITTLFRPSAMVSGLVLQVHNTSEKNLSCKLAVVSETEQQKANYSFSLDPHTMKEIGVLEMNWTFMHGEKCMIRTEGYADSFFSVP